MDRAEPVPVHVTPYGHVVSYQPHWQYDVLRDVPVVSAIWAAPPLDERKPILWASYVVLPQMTVVMEFCCHSRSNFYWIAPPMGEIVSKKRTLLAFHIPPDTEPRECDQVERHRVERVGDDIRVPECAECWWKGEPMPAWLAFYTEEPY